MPGKGLIHVILEVLNQEYVTKDSLRIALRNYIVAVENEVRFELDVMEPVLKLRSLFNNLCFHLKETA